MYKKKSHLTLNETGSPYLLIHLYKNRTKSVCNNSVRIEAVKPAFLLFSP
jgi:hypothetical protein